MIAIGILDGTPTDKIIEIRDSNDVVKAKYVIDSIGKSVCDLMSDHFVEFSFKLNYFEAFKRTDYVMWEGIKYTLRNDYKPVEKNSVNFEYTLKFEAPEMLLQDAEMFYLRQDLKEGEWSLTSDAASFVQIAISNANRYFNTNDWQVGVIEPVTTKYIPFNSVSVFAALTQIAEAFAAEWYITGKTINLVNKVQFGSEVELENEVSVLSMDQSDGDEVSGFTRIVALGSTRNLSPNYRETGSGEAVDAIYQKRLRIPITKGSKIDAWENMAALEAVETTVIFDEVYPKRIGTMSDITTKEYTDTDTDTGVVTKWNAYRYKDAGLTFSKDYILQGVELRLVFQSGYLNGLDFAVKFNPDNLAETNPLAQQFEIVRNTDFGAALPNDNLKPVNGDKYILYGFKIDLVADQYIPVAEQELYEEGVKWVKNNLKDKSVYACPTVIKHFKDNEMDLQIGQKVKLINHRFDGGSRSSRIMGFEKKLINKYDAIYTVGDNSTYTWRNEVNSNIQELQYAGQVFQQSGNGGGVYLIKQFDNTPPSDFNTYSAKASDARYLNKQTGGAVQGDTAFMEDVRVKGKTISDNFGNETFMPGMLGNGFRFWIENGLSYGQLDYLAITREMLISVLTVAEVKSVDGGLMISSANMVCSRVEDIADGYKCYFDNDNGNMPNKFIVDDQAMCRRFNGANVKYYWRLVTEVGSDYILLSKTDKDGSGIPEGKDNIVQFGHRTDSQRQFAIYSVAYGDAGTYHYYDVNSYDLTGKAKTYTNKNGSQFTGEFIIQATGQKVTDAIGEVDGKVETLSTEVVVQAGLISQTITKVESKSSAYKSLSNSLSDRPSVPYYKGDIWITYDGTVKQAKVTKPDGLFLESDWEVSTKYIGQDAIDNIQIGGVNTFKKSTGVFPLDNDGTHGNVMNRDNNGFTLITDRYTNPNEFRLSNVINSNGWWTFSSYIKANYGDKIDIQFCDLFATSLNITNEEQRFEVSFEVKNYTENAYNFIDLVCHSWMIYYFRDVKVEQGNKATAWTPAPEDVQAGIDDAQTAATNAKVAADKAQTDANSANKLLADIADDDLLTPDEKQDVLKEWQIIQGEYPTITAQAATYGVSSSDYTSKYNALSTYVTPLLSNMAINSAIVGTTFRATFKSYYDAKTALLKTVTDRAKALADNAQTDANSANQKANDAQATADSKNRVFLQNLTPTTPSGGFRVGDLWYKENLVDFEGNINADTTKNKYQLTQRWDGSAWVRINWSASRNWVVETDDSFTRIIEKTGIDELGVGETLKSLIDQTPGQIELAVSSIQIGGANYLQDSRLETVSGWNNTLGTPSLLDDPKFGKVVRWQRLTGSGDFIKTFNLDREQLTNTNIVFYVIAKKSSGAFSFGGWNQTFTALQSDTANKIDLGDGWYQYWVTFKSGDSIGTTFGLNSITGDWLFYAAGVIKGTKAADYRLSEEDQRNSAVSEAKASIIITPNSVKVDANEMIVNASLIAKQIEAESLDVGNGNFHVGTDGIISAKGATLSGLFESNSTNNKIKIDPTRRAIVFEDSNGLENTYWGFENPQDGYSRIRFERSTFGGSEVLTADFDTLGVILTTATHQCILSQKKLELKKKDGTTQFIIDLTTVDGKLRIIKKNLPSSPSGLEAGREWRDENGFSRIV